MEQQDAMALIFARNAFYRRLYLLVLAAFALTVVLVCLLAGVLFYIVRNPSRPLYFATDPLSRLIEVIPLATPNMATDQVSNWAVASVEAAFSYDYVNFRSELQSAQKYFTNYGWRDYMKSLETSNNLVALENRRMIVSAHVIDKPVLTKEGILSGAYAYRFEMPVLVTYWVPPYNDKSKFSNALRVNVLIQRQPVLQSYQGLGIIQVIASASSSAT